MVNVAVLASGNGSNFEALFHAKKSYEISCVITDQKDARVIERAKRLHVPYFIISREDFTSRKAHEEAILDILKIYKIDIVCLAGYMRILSGFFLKNLQKRVLNIHPSLLPSFPGRHAIKDAYDHGVKITGVTVFYVDEGVDTGRIIAQEPLRIHEGMSLDELEDHIHKIEHQLFHETLEKVIGGTL